MAGDRPSSDRLWLVFGASSVIFVAVLAISPVKDYLQEYRGIQNDYRGRLIEAAGSAAELRRAEAMTVGIRQIWIPEFDDRVDRCVTCHLGTENAAMAGAPEPFRLHPVTPHTPGEIDRFACVACHRGQGRATSVREAHGRVPDWDSPLLPLRYTEAACGVCHTDDQVPEASLLSTGRALMNRAGCYACHAIKGKETWSSVAPDLDGLRLKTDPAWLRAWLKSPRELRPNTLMPDFRLSEAEIDALTAFLWDIPPSPSQDLGPESEPPPGDAARGKTVFRESRCISCHTIEGRGQGSAPELSDIGSRVNRRWLFAYLGDPHAFQPRTRMPRYAFTRQDRLDLSQYMMDELYAPDAPEAGPPLKPALKSVEEGERLYKMYGCAGCHRITGRDLPAQVGPDLTGIGDRPAALLDYGVRSDLPRRLPDWLAAKVSDPRSFREHLKMPDFGFSAVQVESLVTALLSLSTPPTSPDYRVAPLASHYEPPGRFGTLVDRYRCMSCHQIRGVGGDIATAPLDIEGSRVRRDWLVRYLLLPTTLRPILTERMIPLRMPEEEARFMADFIENVYVDNGIPGEIFPRGASPAQVQRGRSLFFERYGCQACHMVGSRGGYYGPLLDGAGQRLKSGWVAWWLGGPQRWRADVRCPDYGLGDDDALDLAAYIVSIPSAQAGPGTGASRGGSR